jgi:hypothetical protein
LGEPERRAAVEIPADALGFAVVVATLIGTAFGVKLLVWGKEPFKKLRSGATDVNTEERLAELEEHVSELSALVREQSVQLADYDERLDFAERVIAQQRGEPKGLEPPSA